MSQNSFCVFRGNFPKNYFFRKEKKHTTLRGVSALVGELPEESDQFLFLLDVCMVNLKGSVGLI
jgi:hypothetical protein